MGKGTEGDESGWLMAQGCSGGKAVDLSIFESCHDGEGLMGVAEWKRPCFSVRWVKRQPRVFIMPSDFAGSHGNSMHPRRFCTRHCTDV